MITNELIHHLNPARLNIGGDNSGVALACPCGEKFFVSHDEIETPLTATNNSWVLAEALYADHLRGVVLTDNDEAEKGPSTLSHPEARSVERLDTKGALSAFAENHGLRPDWHEPDEQNINARIIGTHLDNAGGSTSIRRVSEDGYDFTEFNIVLTTNGENDEPVKDLAVINLATLLAIATQADRNGLVNR